MKKWGWGEPLLGLLWSMNCTVVFGKRSKRSFRFRLSDAALGIISAGKSNAAGKKKGSKLLFFVFLAHPPEDSRKINKII